MTPDETQEVRTLFKRHFGQTPAHVVHAPGRLELLGNHTGSDDGLLMSVAVDRYIFVASAPRLDGKIELASSAFPGRETFRVNELKRNPGAPWADYVKGVLGQLRKRGVHFSGFNAAVHGTIPIGAGMSSSAALEVAAALTVRQLYPFALSDSGLAVPPKRDEKGDLPPLAAAGRLPLARLCRNARNEFLGGPSRVVDTISSLFGKAWNVMDIDCRALTVEHAPMPGEAVIVCDSGVKPTLAGRDSSELRQIGESAARKLGAKTLRSVELKQVEAGQARLTRREYECARHVVGEIARVVAAGRALRDDDHRQFGHYLFQSHESSRDFLKNSTRELDALVDLARQHPGCLGARLSGSGFGGATVNLVAHHQALDFIAYMTREYERRAGVKMTPLVCRIVDGAA